MHILFKFHEDDVNFEENYENGSIMIIYGRVATTVLVSVTKKSRKREKLK
jgi:hypothetical protein